MQFIFWLSIIVLSYIYVFYPVALFVLSRDRFKSSSKDYYVPSVSVVISAYNEEKNIQSKIDNLLAIDYPSEQVEIIIVSDGSTDSTNDIIRQNHKVKLIESGGRTGKAACINLAVQSAKSDILIMMDVRQVVEKRAIKELVANFCDEQVGAVSGELVFRDLNSTSRTSDNAGFYWKYEKFIRKTESSIDSVQGVTGALYAIRRELMPIIPDGTILDDVFVPMMVIKHGYRVLFEPEAIIYDDPSKDEAIERRRKIRTIAGNYQLIAMNKWLVNPFSNPTFLQFISHKVLRLASPFFMMIALISLFALAVNESGFFYRTMFILSLIAILGAIFQFDKIGFLSKYFKIFSAFLQLNYYALLGCLEYFKNKNIYLWK